MTNDKEHWLNESLAHWQDQGLIDAQKAEELRKSSTGRKNSGLQLAHYFYVIAISCAALAFAAIFINEKFLEHLREYFSLSHLTIAFGCTVTGFILFIYALRKRLFQKQNRDVYLVATLLFWLMGLLYFCKTLLPLGPYTLFLGLGNLLMLAMGYYYKSAVCWLLGLAVLVAWFAMLSTGHSEGSLFLGLNYPARFAVLGGIILLFHFGVQNSQRFSFVGRINFHSGLLLMFCGLWGLSIFGNYGSLEEWSKVRQEAVLLYGIVFGIVAIVSIFLGVRYDNDAARDYGVAFLLLNLYTRYFEFFWDAMSKGLFFLFLAVSFGGLAWWLRKRSRLKNTV